MRARGQCCQCNRGWSGVDCSIPVCWPKKNFDAFQVSDDGKVTTRIGVKITGCYNGICVGSVLASLERRPQTSTVTVVAVLV